MTPKEKARELVGRYYRIDFVGGFGYEEYETLSHGAAKQCAMIAVDEVLNSFLFDSDERHYWQQVKTEIENL